MVNIRAIYGNVPVGSMENSTTTGTFPLSYSTHFVDFDDFETYRTVPKYATLEYGRNLLDGTFINLPDDPVGYGYISTQISGVDGLFTRPITITRTYANNYSAPRLEYSV